VNDLRRRHLPALLASVALIASACGTDTGAAAWEGITNVPDPLEVFDPTLAGEAPSGYRPVLARDQILPVYQPRFVPAAEVSWTDEALVIGVDLAGESRAYPIGFLTTREMVVDNHRGIPTLVTW